MTPYTTRTGVQIGIASMPRWQVNGAAISGPHKKTSLGHRLVPYVSCFAAGFLAALLIWEHFA